MYSQRTVNTSAYGSPGEHPHANAVVMLLKATAPRCPQHNCQEEQAARIPSSACSEGSAGAGCQALCDSGPWPSATSQEPCVCVRVCVHVCVHECVYVCERMEGEEGTG